jgi:glycosyltransferase involved in cell wall biosynthesis
VTRHRVLHFLWTGDIGGAERAVYQIVREEQRRGEWEVGVAFGRATGPWADAITSLGCEVVDLQMRSTLDLARALRSTDRLHTYDIHHFHVLELGQLIASVRCHEATRVFTQRHGAHDAAEPVRKRMRRSLGGVLLRRYLHAVAGNTEHAARYAVERYGLQHLPCRVTCNGIDFSLLEPIRDRSEVRRQLGVGPQTMVVGSSGNFKSWKRFERVVDLLGALPDVHVVLVGDGSLRAAFEARARALGAGDRLHVTGLVSDVADYLQAMDVFILPSSAEESFGNSVVEAMALGIPSVVFSDSPGICEHVEDEVTGFIVDDPAELAPLVARLAGDPDLRGRVGQEGAGHVRARYTLDNMHESYRRLYAAAVSRVGPNDLSSQT